MNEINTKGILSSDNTKRVRRGDLVTVRLSVSHDATLAEQVSAVHVGRVTDVYRSEAGLLRYVVEGLGEKARYGFAFSDQIGMVERENAICVYDPHVFALARGGVSYYA